MTQIKCYSELLSAVEVWLTSDLAAKETALCGAFRGHRELHEGQQAANIEGSRHSRQGLGRQPLLLWRLLRRLKLNPSSQVYEK